MHLRLFLVGVYNLQIYNFLFILFIYYILFNLIYLSYLYHSFPECTYVYSWLELVSDLAVLKEHLYWMEWLLAWRQEMVVGRA